MASDVSPPLPRLLSRAERHLHGKSVRERVSREAFASLELTPDRDSVAILKRQEATRIPFLVPERRKRMLASPFAYLRGAAAVMAADFEDGPTTGLTVQAAGDAHIMNFGTFLSPEGRVLFDCNDFDETLRGVDFTVDVRRLAASLAVAAQDFGFQRKDIRRLVRRAVKSYRKLMRDLALLSPYEIWMQRIDLGVELTRIDDRRLRAHIGAALSSLDRGGVHDDDVPHLDPKTDVLRFEDRDTKIFHADFPAPEAAGLIAEAERALLAYPSVLLPERRRHIERYRLVDTAIKVVGVGSVGTLCAIGLYATPDREMIVLQLKEAQASVNVPLALPGVDAPVSDNGRRVVEGQRAIQAASDIFLAAVPPLEPHTRNRHFYVRHLKTTRLASLGDLIARDLHEEEALSAYGELCARTLARAHARTGDSVAIAAYLGSSDAFDEAVAAFAIDYIDITDADFSALQQCA